MDDTYIFLQLHNWYDVSDQSCDDKILSFFADLVMMHVYINFIYGILLEDFGSSYIDHVDLDNMRSRRWVTNKYRLHSLMIGWWWLILTYCYVMGYQ